MVWEKFHSFLTFFCLATNYWGSLKKLIETLKDWSCLRHKYTISNLKKPQQLKLPQESIFFKPFLLNWWVLQIYEIYKIFLNLRSSSFLISIRNLSFESLVAAFILTAAICMDSEIGILKHINFHDFKIRMTELLIHNSSIARSNLYGSTNLPL